MSKSSDIPSHVAIIMDGNGRWAQIRGKDRVYGHMNGVESVRASLRAARRNGVRYLTLYAFSTENWGRPAEEIGALMELFCKCVVCEADELVEQGVEVKVIGDRDGMTKDVQQHLRQVEDRTANGDKLTLILALNYSSRWEITQMVKKIAFKAANGEVTQEGIDQNYVSANMCTASLPDPDLLIRTSGECRLSNFLLWQLAYSELYFTETLWPDFNENEFDKAIKAYSERERRFGLVK